MLRYTIRKCSALILGVAVASPAIAQDIEIAGNVTLASDYSFRGWSQTDRAPAVQGGFDIDFGNGFSVGTWASNVNFGDNTSMELDLYAGFSGSVNEDISWSASIIRFEYPNEGESLDYMEANVEVGFGDFAVGLNISPEYLGADGPGFQYPYASYSVSVADNASVSLSVGLSMTGEDDYFADGEDSYMDFSAGVSTTVGGADLGATIVGTSLDEIEGTETRVVLSLSKSL